MGHRPSATSLESELSPDELAFLLELIKSNRLAGRYLEIGTAAGGTLCQMMRCFEPTRIPPFVVVDPMSYFPDQLEIVQRNLRQHQLDPARVDFRIAASADAFPRAVAARENYDFMLIDGAHKIRYVTLDLRWARLLNVGGLVCFHDYNTRHKGVLWSVDRFLRKHGNYRRETLTGNLLAVRKDSASRTAEIDRIDTLWSLLLAPWLQVELSLAKRRRKRSAP